MDLTYYGRHKGGVKVGPRPKSTIFGSVLSTIMCQKELKFSKLIIVALHSTMLWQFHWYKNKHILVRDGTGKAESWKIFFLYLNKKIILEHLIQEETNTDTLGFTFHPFTICKWVLESEIQNISIVENLPRPFSGYVYIKETNFCNYKFCSSSKFSNISLLKFAPKVKWAMICKTLCCKIFHLRFMQIFSK